MTAAHTAPCPLRVQLVTAVVLATGFEGHTTQDLPSSVAVVALIFICIFVAGFAW